MYYFHKRTSACSYNNKINNNIVISIGSGWCYDISFFVSVSIRSGQLELIFNGSPVASTVTGIATGTNYIMVSLLLNLAVVNSVLTVRNPTGNSVSLTITPIVGRASVVSVHLRIVRLS